MAVPHPASSQAPVTLTGEPAVEQSGRQRWMHGHQEPRFTRFNPIHDWIIVDSIGRAGADQRIWLTLARSAYGRDSALIIVRPGGRVARLDFGRASRPSARDLFPGDSARWADLQRRGPAGDVSLGETRLWDLVPTSPPHEPRVGLSWRDTIARVASDGAFRQAMRGNRTSRIVGQRALNGHSVWIVRDSAAVSYEEHYPGRERTIDGATVSRSASGTIVGVHLWDPALLLALRSDDTTRLSGQAVLRYADGRSFRTPARFERTRHQELLDAPAYAARIAELRASRSRASGGMVLVPNSPLQQRLATCDTAYLYQQLESRAYPNHPFDTTAVRAMLPFLKDPGLPWSFDLSRDVLYENLAQALTTWPPASAASSAGASACTPAACTMLAEQWTQATEPRLRDVGLVASFVTDPARWTDTVLALAGPSRPLLRDAALLARGVGATWPAASKASMPPPNSDWRAWLEWMDGRDPRDVAITRRSSLPPQLKGDTLPHVRFEQSHITAIRFTEARTGRDIVAELQHGYDTAPSDSARLVYGTMLQALGKLELTEPQVLDAFRSGDPARIALARRALGRGFRSSHPADTTVSVPLLQQLLAAIVDSAPLWPNEVDERGAHRGDPAALHRSRGRFFIDTIGLPPRIRAEWGSRVEILPESAWNARDVRSPSVFYRIEPIATWGQFARVQVTATQRYARQPDETPQAYAFGVTYWLMNVEGQWVIVGESRWVT